MTEHDELSQMLRDKVQTFDARPSDLPQVEARAHGIRARRRIAAVSAVAAAVVAVAVPTALTLGPDDPSGTPLRPTPTGPTTSPSTSAPAVSTLSQIAQGGQPKVDWMEGLTVHLDGGRTMTLPDGTWNRFAPYRGGVVAGSTNEIADEIVVVGADGQVVSRSSGTGPVLSPDRGQVTWWSGDGRAFTSGPTSQTGGAVDTRVPVTANRPRPVGFLDGQLVYRVDSDTGGVAASCGPSCAVRISGATQVFAVNSARHLLAGYTDGGCPTKVFHVPDLAGSTSRTVEATSQWPCVRDSPQSFSPDGTALALEHQANDRTETLTARDSTSGRLLMRYQAPRGVRFSGSEWEDDSHVLVIAFSPGYAEWTLLRLGLDGSVERAAPVVAGDDTANPFALGAQP